MIQPAGQVSPDGKWLWNGTQWVPCGPLVARLEGPPWARPYEPARSRATWVTVLLAANCVAILLGIAFDFALIGNHGGTGAIPQAAIDEIGLLAAVFLVADIATSIPAIVLFCMWLHRVVRNMPALGVPYPQWSPAGAVWRCFIPVLNLLHPLYGVLDAWRGADPRVRQVYDRKELGSPPLIIAWWAAWLSGSWVSSTAGRMTNSGNAGIATIGAWADVVGSLLLIGAAVLAILVVRNVTARQEHKHELMVTGQLA